MSLQKRLIVSVLLAAALAWMLTVAGTYWRAMREIDELYDTDMVRMAQQALAVARLLPASTPPSPEPLPERLPADKGHASLGDVSIAIWRGAGAPLVLDPGAQQFPRGHTQGFLDTDVNGAPWRLYYLDDPAGSVRVAVGQRLGERNELAVNYVLSQMLPWLIGLPILIAALVVAVRRSLAPVRRLSRDLERRKPEDASPLPMQRSPDELKPLIRAMNGLLSRVAALIDQERRLTADAAHELRTPLAALRAQWDVLQRTGDPGERSQVQARVARGLERLDRLVSQLLTMARLDSAVRGAAAAAADWRQAAELALGDCLWIADRRDIDIDVEWPPAGQPPLPMAGDTAALSIMLKNLLDNAIRYAPRHSRVRLTFTGSRIFVDDQGAGIAPQILPRLGERFVRAAGNEEAGSGLGISIALRIARNHGLALRFSMRDAGAGFGPGLRVTILPMDAAA
ncbi:ATP-binding protein [Bordetella genomosp. 9]|uniref:histidine kinase n=1 Tax=Bordetella genomosp. 9 TaxID=1416803 RepID=A0A1W6Z0J3_9BORD|nr:ATP-binding protein [Bordetella genomosp. 9]ARP86826.1 two-component sensor histidine kinase [Bordetella genomosp. 9]ARP90812.1 two-component sensor histidine kinase [Bordetella genomosp. 9]